MPAQNRDTVGEKTELSAHSGHLGSLSGVVVGLEMKMPSRVTRQLLSPGHLRTSAEVFSLHTCVTVDHRAAAAFLGRPPHPQLEEPPRT